MPTNQFSSETDLFIVRLVGTATIANQYAGTDEIYMRALLTFEPEYARKHRVQATRANFFFLREVMGHQIGSPPRSHAANGRIDIAANV